MNKKKFAVIIETFSDLCGKQLKTATIDAYYNVLSKYSDEEVEKAAEHILKNHRFNTIPLPAVFISAIEGTAMAKAAESWNSVLYSVRSGNGGYTECAISNKVVSILGNLRDLKSDEIPFAMRNFINLYKDLSPTFEASSQKGLKNEVNENLQSLTKNIGKMGGR